MPLLIASSRRVHGERAVNFLAVQGHDFIARFQTGQRGGTVRGDVKNDGLGGGGDQNLPQRLAFIPFRRAMEWHGVSRRLPCRRGDI